MPFTKKIISGDGSAIGGDVINKINDRLDEVDSQLDTKANKTEIPTKVSQLENDSGFTTETYDDSAIKNQIKILDDKIDEVDSQLENNTNEISYVNNNLLNNKINVKFPPKVEFEGSILEGLKCDGTDQLEKFLRLCKYVRQNSNYLKGAVMYFPSGEYTFSKIPMYSYISIIGDGKRNTIFKPVEDSSATELFYINQAPVQYSTYANFTVDCVSENINQTCFNIYAQYLGTPSGGCWYCNFNNIEIKNFKNGFKFSLEEDSYDLANQFLNFNDVIIYRPNNLDSRCILGGGNQFTYTSCEFSCTNNGSIGTNIETSGHCNFIMLTCQNADYGIVITSGKVNIYNAWFENIKYSITDKSTTSVNTVIDIFGGTFSNAGYDGNDSGYIVKTESITTRINLYSPTIKGLCDKVYVDKWDTQNGIHLYGSISNNKKTSYKTKQFATLEETKRLFGFKTILINSGGIIKNIDENYENGDMVTIKCLGDVTIKTGGNINIDKDISLNISDTVTLVKSDLSGAWFIVSIFKHSMY